MKMLNKCIFLPSPLNTIRRLKTTRLWVQNSHPVKCKETGFTLLELIVVVSISAIILLIALPNLQNTLQRNQADAQIQNLFRHWQHARSLAISQQKSLRVCGSNDGNNCSLTWSNYMLVFHDTNNDKVASQDEILQIQSLDIDNASVISGFALGQASLLINSRGYANLTGSFVYCPASKKSIHIRRLSWSASGRPYFGRDNDNDGVIEASNGNAMTC